MAVFCAHMWPFQLLTYRCATVFGVGLTLTNFCCWLWIIYTQIGVTPPRFLDSLAEDSSFLGCEAVSLNKWVLMFWRQYDPPNVCNYLPKQCRRRESSVWHYSCLRTSSLYTVPPRSHYKLNQFTHIITTLSRGMIQCFSCLKCWIAGIDRCHHTVSMRVCHGAVRLPYRSHIMRGHTPPMQHNKTLLQVDVLSIILRICGFTSTTSTDAPWQSHSFWHALPSWLLSLHCVTGLFNPPFATFNPR